VSSSERQKGHVGVKKGKSCGIERGGGKTEN